MARILVVEDDEEIVDLLERSLVGAGHRVTAVGDGREAYQRIYLAYPSYDLVLCDLALPSMPGTDLLRRVEIQLRPYTPVVVLSGEGRLVDSLGDIRDWIFGLVTKPFRMDLLLDMVEQALLYRGVLLENVTQEERITELEQRIDALVKDNTDLFEEARLDPLTRLPNRRRLEEDLGRKHANTDRYGASFAFALHDVDEFRRFNAELGYEGGDLAIRHVARLLRLATREGDTVYRYGGDEFVVVMEAQTLEQGVQVSERLRQAVVDAAVPQAIGGSSERITVSAGVAAVAPGDKRSVRALIRAANRHLRVAKKEGGNRVRPRFDGEAASHPVDSTASRSVSVD